MNQNSDVPGLDERGPNPWTTRGSRVLFTHTRMQVREDEVTQPDGEPGTYTYVEVPDPVVAIVPVSADGKVYVVRQWRYPWARNSWEIPAGHCEPDEEIRAAAERELAEEIGMRAGVWQSLGEGYGSAALTARYHLFLARDLTQAECVSRDGAEHDMIVASIPLLDAVEAAQDGRIQHAISVVGLLRAARLLGI